MEKYTFLIVNCILFIPLLSFLTLYYRKQISKNKKFILLVVCVGILMDIIEDIFGIHWQAWIYDSSKSLGIISPGINIDTLVFGVGVAFTLAVLVAVLAEKEEKKKSFWPF